MQDPILITDANLATAAAAAAVPANVLPMVEPFAASGKSVAILSNVLIAGPAHEPSTMPAAERTEEERVTIDLTDDNNMPQRGHGGGDTPSESTEIKPRKKTQSRKKKNDCCRQTADEGVTIAQVNQPMLPGHAALRERDNDVSNEVGPSGEQVTKAPKKAQQQKKNKNENEPMQTRKRKAQPQKKKTEVIRCPAAPKKPKQKNVPAADIICDSMLDGLELPTAEVHPILQYYYY